MPTAKDVADATRYAQHYANQIRVQQLISQNADLFSFVQLREVPGGWRQHGITVEDHQALDPYFEIAFDETQLDCTKFSCLNLDLRKVTTGGGPQVPHPCDFENSPVMEISVPGQEGVRYTACGPACYSLLKRFDRNTGRPVASGNMLTNSTKYPGLCELINTSPFQWMLFPTARSTGDEDNPYTWSVNDPGMPAFQAADRVSLRKWELNDAYCQFFKKWFDPEKKICYRKGWMKFLRFLSGTYLSNLSYRQDKRTIEGGRAKISILPHQSKLYPMVSEMLNPEVDQRSGGDIESKGGEKKKEAFESIQEQGLVERAVERMYSSLMPEVSQREDIPATHLADIKAVLQKLDASENDELIDQIFKHILEFYFQNRLTDKNMSDLEIKRELLRRFLSSSDVGFQEGMAFMRLYFIVKPQLDHYFEQRERKMRQHLEEQANEEDGEEMSSVPIPGPMDPEEYTKPTFKKWWNEQWKKFNEEFDQEKNYKEMVAAAASSRGPDSNNLPDYVAKRTKAITVATGKLMESAVKSQVDIYVTGTKFVYNFIKKMIADFKILIGTQDEALPSDYDYMDNSVILIALYSAMDLMIRQMGAVLSQTVAKTLFRIGSQVAVRRAMMFLGTNLLESVLGKLLAQQVIKALAELAVSRIMSQVALVFAHLAALLSTALTVFSIVLMVVGVLGFILDAATGAFEYDANLRPEILQQNVDQFTDMYARLGQTSIEHNLLLSPEHILQIALVNELNASHAYYNNQDDDDEQVMDGTEPSDVPADDPKSSEEHRYRSFYDHLKMTANVTPVFSEKSLNLELKATIKYLSTRTYNSNGQPLALNVPARSDDGSGAPPPRVPKKSTVDVVGDKKAAKTAMKYVSEYFKAISYNTPRLQYLQMDKGEDAPLVAKLERASRLDQVSRGAVVLAGIMGVAAVASVALSFNSYRYANVMVVFLLVCASVIVVCFSVVYFAQHQSLVHRSNFIRSSRLFSSIGRNHLKDAPNKLILNEGMAYKDAATAEQVSRATGYMFSDFVDPLLDKMDDIFETDTRFEPRRAQVSPPPVPHFDIRHQTLNNVNDLRVV